jgi:hypothetical protein
MHSLAFTHDAPANPAAGSREQHTLPFEQSSGPSQVIGTLQRRRHVASVLTLVKAGQQGAVVPPQGKRPQNTLVAAASVGCVQFGLVAE